MTEASVEKELTSSPEEAEKEAQQELQTVLDQLAEEQKKTAEHWDRLLRVQAELENVKRRAEKDMSNAHKFGLEKILKELLPVLDSLEMALQALASLEAEHRTGVELTHKLLLSALEKQGIQVINPLNQPFNPQHHEAVTTQVNPETAPDTVLSVMQKGYLLHERLLRPALVVVSSQS